MSFDLKIANGNLVLNNGQLKTVVDSEKLIQDILKIALTDPGTNPIHVWYGSYVSKSLIGNPNYIGVLEQIGKSQLTNALENLQQIQQLQVQSLQRVSADEQINAIKDINISQDRVDPRLYNILIYIISKGLKPITTSFKVSSIQG